LKISRGAEQTANKRKQENMENYHYKKNVLLVYGFNNRIADCRTISAPCHNYGKLLKE
jgi:hypothetical protein